MLSHPWLDRRKTASPRRRAARPLSVERLEDRCVPSADVVLEWNQIILDTVKADRVLPVLVPRDLAIVSTAVYDAVNDIDRSYTPFFADVQALRGASLEAAAAQAAHDTLAALFPAHQATFDAILAADLVGIPPGRASQGVAVGQAVAQQILAWRSTDGSNAQVSYVPGTGPGVWQPTPPAFAAAAVPQWGHVTPFGIPGDSAFRPPPPPALNSPEYTAAFNEVKSLGAANSTTRTADQSEIARFWYGAAGTFTAGGYWDQIAQGVAVQRGNSLVQNARLFALLNMAQADATFAIWDAKYTYNFWRPVTAILAADTDGNPDTVADPTWTPFLVTPNHPSYTSGHSGVSGAAAAVLAAFFGSDDIAFSFSSDSLPGVTRSYASFSAALQECSDSRIYAGIHWRFDVQTGQVMGGEVGAYIFGHFLRPASEADDGDSGGGDREDAARAAGRDVAGDVAFDPTFLLRGTSTALVTPPAADAGGVSPGRAADGLSGIVIGTETRALSASGVIRSVPAPTQIGALDRMFTDRSGSLLAGAFEGDGRPAWEG